MAWWKSVLVGTAWLVPVATGCQKVEPTAVDVIRPVKMHRIGSLDATAYREYPGTIEAHQEARMAFEVSGVVTQFFVREGDEVESGQIIAELDPRDYEARLRASQADLNKAQATLARSLGIRAQNVGAIADEQIDQDRRLVEVAEAQLAISQKAVDDTRLRAPFAGRIARKLVPDFANVQAKAPVLVLQDISILEIKVNVPERDMARKPRPELSREEINAQLQPQVMVSAIPHALFPASIKEFATMAEPVTRTFVVTLNFEPVAEYTILPGMTARVRVIVDPDRAWSVPTTAVQQTPSEQAFVWTVDPETMAVSQTPVQLAEGMSDGAVRLESGVQDGDLVAISGVALLREGMRVREFAIARQE